MFSLNSLPKHRIKSRDAIWLTLLSSLVIGLSFNDLLLSYPKHAEEVVEKYSESGVTKIKFY